MMPDSACNSSSLNVLQDTSICATPRTMVHPRRETLVPVVPRGNARGLAPPELTWRVVKLPRFLTQRAKEWQTSSSVLKHQTLADHTAYDASFDALEIRVANPRVYCSTVPGRDQRTRRDHAILGKDKSCVARKRLKANGQRDVSGTSCAPYPQRFLRLSMNCT